MSKLTFLDIDIFEKTLAQVECDHEVSKSDTWYHFFQRRPYDAADASDRCHQDKFFYEIEKELIEKAALLCDLTVSNLSVTAIDLLFYKEERNEMSYEEYFNICFYKKEIMKNLNITTKVGENPVSQTTSSQKLDELKLTKKYKTLADFRFLESPTLLSVTYSIPECEVVKVIDCVEAMIELYVLFGYLNPQSKSWLIKNSRLEKLNPKKWTAYYRSCTTLYRTVHLFLQFVSANGEGSWVKFLKWKFATFFAYVRDQDLPPKPDFVYPLPDNQFWKPNVLLGGNAHDFIQSLKKREIKKYMQFVDSSQQLKKAMPDVPEGMVEKSKIDCRIALTSEPKQLAESDVYQIEVSCEKEDFFCLIDEFGQWPKQSSEDFGFVFDFYSKKKSPIYRTNRADIELNLKRTTRELFDGVPFGREIFEPFFPSVSANYINSRGQCGSLNSLYEKHSFGKKGDCINLGTHKMRVTEEFSKFYGFRGKNDQAWCDHLNSMNNEFTEHLDPTEHFETDVEGVVADVSKLREVWKQFYIDLYHDALEERPLVSTVGLPEPLKVRVISKGPPLLYTFLKPFQKWLWKTLKSNRVFNLIGRYVTEEDINKCLGSLPDNYEAVSGDYKASTDNLHSWVSECILDELMCIIGDSVDPEVVEPFGKNFLLNLKSLFRKALTRHIFVEDGIEYPQKEGQLMGSIISFPFLCIANAALCRMAMEIANSKVYRVRDKPFPGSGKICPLLVNGDDCLLSGIRGRIRPLWEAICAFAGLESSIGKTYFSESFCTINSTIFERNMGGRWVEQKYINLGLMKGLKRMGAGGNKSFNSQVDLHQLGTICRELKRSCPTTMWEKVKSRFIHYNFKTLASMPTLSWYLPEWMGGIGLPIDRPDEITDHDRQIATLIRKNYGKPGYQPVVPKDMAMWLMHKRVMNDSKEINVPLVNYKKVIHEEKFFDIKHESQELYKLMTVNLLMKESLETLHQEVKEDKSVVAALRKNIRVMERANKDLIKSTYNSDLGPAWTVGKMDIEELGHETKELLRPTVIKDLYFFMQEERDPSRL